VPKICDPWQRSQEEDEQRRQAVARSGRGEELLAPSEYSAMERSVEADEEDLPCRCVRADVDVEDARDCPLHGPESELALRARQQEADDLAAYYAHSPFDEEPG
jgi:hypothetical protein